MRPIKSRDMSHALDESRAGSRADLFDHGLTVVAFLGHQPDFQQFVRFQRMADFRQYGRRQSGSAGLDHHFAVMGQSLEMALLFFSQLHGS